MKLTMFTSPYCGPCKTMKPVIDRLSQEHGFTVEKVELSADNRSLFDSARVRNVPTLLVTDSAGAEVKRATGGMTEAALVSFLKDTSIIKGQA